MLQTLRLKHGLLWQKNTRPSCAKVCDARAEKCAAKAETTDDQDDRTELKSNAWQFSVLAAEIRKRSNAKLSGPL